MSNPVVHIEPKLGEGVYLIRDVSKILHLEYEKTYRWIVGYWGLVDGGLSDKVSYTFGDSNNRAINFFSLIEFYTFFKLREKGVSAPEIRKLHNKLAEKYNAPYPFAIAHDFHVDGRKRKTFVYYNYLNTLIKFDKKDQYSFRFVEGFLAKVEFGDDNIAKRLFPLNNSRNVVVDPKHQFGQPIVSGTNIKTQTLFSLHRGGESVQNISELYGLSIDQVKDAIAFQLAA